MLDLTPPLLLFLLPLAYSPGPGNSFFAALGARDGLRATMPASFGYHLATALVTVATGLGFATAIATVGPVFEILRYAGAIWVIWIAWRIWSAPPAQQGQGAASASMVDGAILLLLNPKAWLIIALMFTQFLPQGGDPALVLWITVIFTLNNFLAFTLWSAAGDLLGRLFATEVSARWLNRMFALSLAGVAVWMIGR